MKILCFHPALAPYRIDFFNLLAKKVDLKMVFLQENLQTQKFDQSKLLASLNASYVFLTQGICIRGRCIRTGLLREIKRECPDVVVGYEASPVTLALVMFRKLRLTKAEVWTFMDDSPDLISSRKGLRRIVRDFVVRNVNKVIVPSAAAAVAYQRLDINHYPQAANHFSVVPIIHDTSTIRANAGKVYKEGQTWRTKTIPSVWSKVLLFVGRLTAIKNIPWLLDRMVELSEDVGLVLVGDGDEEQVLKDRAATMGLSSRVMFVGRKEGDELYAMMAMADGLVLCSHSETFGAVVAEALQWGTPCIVAHHIGASVLIEGDKNGVVFTSGDAAAFRSAIAHLPPRAEVSLLLCDLRAAVKDLIDGGAA